MSLFIKNYLNIKITRHQRAVFRILKHFECDHCGRCCNIPVSLFPKEVEEIIRKTKRRDFFTIVAGMFYMKKPCPFRTNGRCSIYQFRPLSCRTFPFWAQIPRLLDIEKCRIAREISKVVEKNFDLIVENAKNYVDENLERKIERFGFKIDIDNANEILNSILEKKFGEGEDVLCMNLTVEFEEALADLLEKGMIKNGEEDNNKGNKRSGRIC